MSYQNADRFSPDAPDENKLVKNALLNLLTFLLVVAMFGFGCKFSTDDEPPTTAPIADSASKKTEKPVEKNAEIEVVSFREIVFKN